MFDSNPPENPQDQRPSLTPTETPHEHLNRLQARYDALESCRESHGVSEGKKISGGNLPIPVNEIRVPESVSFRAERDDITDVIGDYIDKCVLVAFDRIGYDIANMAMEDVEDMKNECRIVNESDTVSKYFHRDTLLMTIRLKLGGERIEATVDYPK